MGKGVKERELPAKMDKKTTTGEGKSRTPLPETKGGIGKNGERAHMSPRTRRRRGVRR